MNVELGDKVYDTLKLYLQNKSSYSPYVLKRALKESDKFPLVTLEEIDNVQTGGTTKTRIRELTSKIEFEINIYAIDKSSGSKIIAAPEISNELKALVDKVMTNYFQFTRTVCKPTPNLDDTIYRVTMRYEVGILESKNILY